jgi:hypothetical protein
VKAFTNFAKRKGPRPLARSTEDEMLRGMNMLATLRRFSMYYESVFAKDAP